MKIWKAVEMRDYERKAIAEAAYLAWLNGRNYDTAWDRAEAAVCREQPLDYLDAEAAANCAAFRKRVDNSLES